MFVLARAYPRGRPAAAFFVVFSLSLVWCPAGLAERPGPASAARSEHGLAARLRAHVSILAGDIGERNVFQSRALRRASDYIARTWTELSLKVRRQEVRSGSSSSDNLECDLFGSSAGRPLILLGAHYDTVRGSPGADDNASGVAALLELARMLGARGEELPVRFVAFTNEEKLVVTGHQGSRAYARNARARGDKIRLMLSLDTIGYFTDVRGSQRYPFAVGKTRSRVGDFIGFVTREQDRPLLDALCGIARRLNLVPIECMIGSEETKGIGWSDHASFWEEGYPALMVTDTAMFRSTRYHSISDTPDTLDYSRLARVVEMLAAAIGEMTRSSGRPRGNSGAYQLAR